jgi:ABC-type molybdate transport system substrate-binding protein
MKNMKKVLFVAVIALIAVVCTSSVVSAGFFDFLSGDAGDDSEGEVNLAAAASLKNVYDEKQTFKK